MADDLFADIPVNKQVDDLFADLPADKRTAALRRALIDAKPSKKTVFDTPSGRMLNSMLLGLPDLYRAGSNALLVDLQNKVPGGVRPTYTAADAFEAERLAAKARRDKFSAQKPLTSTALDIGGGLMTPGGPTIGKWVVGTKAPALTAAGKKVPVGTRTAQTVRASTVGGALTGTQAAVQSKPGEELEEGRRGALTGAVMAPVMGVTADLAIKAAPKVTRVAKSVVGRGPTPEITSVEKLQKMLRQAGVTPEAVEAASREWTEMGGVTPALIDIVKTSGGSSEVMRLLARSPSKAPQRKLAENYAKETVGGAQKTALEQAEKLPTFGETRTPAAIKADLDAQNAQIDADLVDDVAAAEAAKLAGTKEAPAAPRPRESGAATFADEFNRLYDVSQKKYQDAYDIAEAAAPEAALVVDDEVRPLFDKLKIPQNFDDALPGVAAVKNYLGKKKNDIAPGDAGGWPEGEAMGLAQPLSVLEMQKMRQVLSHYAEKYADEPGGALAARFKSTIDDELARLSAENKITGDPEIVAKWNEAIQGRAEHGRNFGSGLAAKITARGPDGKRKVESFRAGDEIFGAPGEISLNKALSELDPMLNLVSPESVRALQEELYGRVKLADLPKLRETTGGKRLLPEDLSLEAIAAQESVPVAEADAAAMALAAEERAASRRELTTRQRGAVELGERAINEERQAFEPAMDAVEASDLPLAAAGAKSGVIGAIEGRDPELGSINNLISVRATENLGRAISPNDVASFQARMKAIQERGRTAQVLQNVVDEKSAMHTDPLIESVTNADLAYPRRGAVDAVMSVLRRGNYLTDAEYTAALKTLTSTDPAAKDALLNGLLKKYPAAKRALSPLLTRPFSADGDEMAVEDLEEEYGLP